MPTEMLKFERWPSTAFRRCSGTRPSSSISPPGLLQCLAEGGVGVVVGIVQAQAVCQRDVLVLGVDELDDVGMRDSHDSHLGPPSGASLCDGLTHLVEGPHERDRSASDAARRADGVSVGTKLPEGIPHATAAVVRDDPVGDVLVVVRDGDVVDRCRVGGGDGLDSDIISLTHLAVVAGTHGVEARQRGLIPLVDEPYRLEEPLSRGSRRRDQPELWVGILL